MASDYAIEFHQVVKRFGSITAVDHVSLQINKGEFFSLLGPSGCGKTTSLRIIAGFENADQGDIFISGQSIAKLPPYRRPVNTVFQNYALFPHMTVYQNVAFGLEMDKIPAKEKRQRVLAMLDLVRLPGLENRQPRQLSGGQQQRVALARALIKQPKVLLLDEPLGALDLKLRKAMQLELKNLQTQLGITFVYVTHDQEEALTMSERIAVMDHGNVLQIGTPQEIYECPGNRFVADFIGESNFIETKLETIGIPVTVRTKSGQRLTAELVEEHLNPGDASVLSIRPEKIQLYPVDYPLAKSGQNITKIHGSILQAVYLGTDTRYIIDIDMGQKIIARQQNLNGTETRFCTGDLVQVVWDAHHARIFQT